MKLLQYYDLNALVQEWPPLEEVLGYLVMDKVQINGTVLFEGDTNMK